MDTGLTMPVPEMMELCGNGIDDDGDGLVDCFDPDCCINGACKDNYYNSCDSECLFNSTSDYYDLNIEWALDEVWFPHNTPIIGDIDGDNEVEIVGVKGPWTGNGNYQNLLIINGSTGTIEAEIQTPFFNQNGTSIAIADVDGNGRAEIFIFIPDIPANLPTQANRIQSYEYNGIDYQLKWQSVSPANGNIIGLADFNEDNRPEVYAGTSIYDSFTGNLLVTIPTINSNISGFSLAADVLPDTYCNYCEGLELVAGNQVFSLTIDPFFIASNEIVLAQELNNQGNGFTALADMDKDGDLDAVVTNADGLAQATVYIWDIQTPILLASYSFISEVQGRVSVPTIADFDGDSWDEIVVSSIDGLRLIQYDGNILTESWKINTTNSSGLSGSTAFDFDSDGIYELVHRDEMTLNIIDGESGNILFQTACNSPTYNEYPVIADADGDGETELICNCESELRAYSSESFTWVPTRKIWNQYAFFNTNIEDDLTIPIQQQGHHIVGDSVILNNFLTQYSSESFPIADAVINIENIACDPDWFDVTFTICNNGHNVLSAEAPLSIYMGNPNLGSSILLEEYFLPNNLQAEECITTNIILQAQYETTYYFVMNDDNSIPIPFELANLHPVTPIPECNYENNLDTFFFEYYGLNIGGDYLFCEPEPVFLEAGNQFNSYLWQDGSSGQNHLALEPGIYWVEVQDYCGNVQRDSVKIALEEIPEISINESFTLCEGESMTLSAPGFSNYQWTPAIGLNCTDCPSVIATPASSTVYSLTASTALGCVATSTITIEIADEPIETFEEQNLCEGESLNIFSYSVNSAGVYIEEFITENGCDSIHTITVTLQETFQTNETQIICAGDFANVFGTPVYTSGDYSLTYSAQNGCDSTHLISVEVVDTFSTQQLITICDGDTVTVFGNAFSEDGIYTQTFAADNGCDSTHIIIVNVQETVATFENQLICDGTSAIIFGNQVNTGGIFSQTFTNQNGCDSTHTINVEVIENEEVLEMAELCEGESIDIFGESVNMAGVYTQSFTANNGCDSTHSVIVQILDTVLNHTYLNLCHGDTVLIFGNAVFTDGVFAQTFLSTNGCDSTHFYEVEMKESYQNFTFTTLCPGDTAFFEGVPILEQGSYFQTYAAHNGCDSTEILEVEVLNQFTTIETISLCPGESAAIFGNLENAAGLYEQTFIAQNGCDSIHQISLEVKEIFETNEVMNTCPGNPTLIFGEWTTQAGIYEQTFVAENGCDSIHIIELFSLNTFSTEESLAICQGEAADIFGTSITTAGTYAQNYIAQNGCDSTHTFFLEVLDNSATFETFLLCKGDSVEVFNTAVSGAGIFTGFFPAANGCDSTHTVNVEILSTQETSESISLCPDESVDIFGQSVSAPGIYSATFVAQNGCDSIHSIVLETLQAFETQEAIPICYGESVDIFGDPISLPGTYTNTFIASNGCDSTHTIFLNWFEIMELELTGQAGCPNEHEGSLLGTISGGTPPYQYFWNVPSNNSFQLQDLPPGDYALTVSDANGCTISQSIILEEESDFSFQMEVMPVTCHGENDGSIWIHSQNAALEFSLNGQAFQQEGVFENLYANNYDFVITDSYGCSTAANASVEQPPFVDISLPPDLTIELGDSIKLIAQATLDEADLNINWWPLNFLSCSNCLQTGLKPLTTTRYEIEVMDENGCSARDEILVTVKNRRGIFIPNSFSPNHDGTNDLFIIYGDESVWKVHNFKIFSRWGGLIFNQKDFSPNDPAFGWNGRAENQNMDPGVYVYVAEIEFIDGEIFQYAGDVTLVK